VNYEFDLQMWMDRFPLTERYGHLSGEPIITSPNDLCNREWLRQLLEDKYTWGAPVPVDIFVMSRGEPENRAATKIGGLPYRPAGTAWPKFKSGAPMALIAQFNFTNSVDIVGKQRGDVLLAFGGEDEDGLINVAHFEWHRLGLTDLIRSEQMPDDCLKILPCYGNRCRVMSYPDAKRKFEGMHPVVDGKEILSPQFVATLNGTQIGRAPYYVQASDSRLPGRPLCCISSVQPAMHGPYPWVNVAEPHCKPDDWDFGSLDGYLMIGDAGSIYISIDRFGRLHSGLSCF